MRILLSCLQSPHRYPIPAYDFWRRYFIAGLEEAGHEVVEAQDVDWARGLILPAGPDLLAWQANAWQAVHTVAGRERIDLFLGYLFPRQVDTGAVRELQRKGVPCVNFFCDNLREFRRAPLEFAPFALHWVPEFEALPMYRAAGLAHLHAPMACWVPPDLRQPPDGAEEPATFIGSADLLRADLLGRALQAGADFVVRGAGWNAAHDLEAIAAIPRRLLGERFANQVEALRRHGAVAIWRKVEARVRPLPKASVPSCRIGEAPSDSGAYFRLTRAAAVTIGINRVPTARASHRRPLAYSRLRDIEAPMLGACYLTEWTAGLPHLYDLGTEIETYRDVDELTRKLGELRASPGRRAELRARAQQRALADHTIGKTIARIGEKLGIVA